MKYSVVIPTTGSRLRSLARALDSVAKQTSPAAEVLVVLDAEPALASERMVELVKSLPDWASVLANNGPKGPSSARMTGVRAASSSLIAFLDDDDSWLPEKMEFQIARYLARPLLSEQKNGVVVLTRCLIHGSGRDYVWPSRLPRPGESAAEYLYRRPSLLFPDAYIATPSIMAPRELLLRFPFREDMRQMEDIEWLVRVTNSGTGFVYCPEVLTVVEGRRAIDRDSLAGQSLGFDWNGFADEVLDPLGGCLARNYRLTFGVREAKRATGRSGAFRQWGRSVIGGRFAWRSAVEGLIEAVVPVHKPMFALKLLHALRSLKHRSFT